jgi:hypothetical protein
METFKKCKVTNCGKKQKYLKKGYCCKHYQQIKQHGKILERTMFDPNEIIDCDDYYEICLYNRKHEEVGRTLIDKEDLEKIKGYKWYLSRGYVSTRKKNYTTKLHQLILGKKEGYEIDHINHDKFDNRKKNLRFATRSQNGMNKKCKGYKWDNNCWQVRIKINKKEINLGRFENEQTAAKVAQEARQRYFGEFAYKNN